MDAAKMTRIARKIRFGLASPHEASEYRFERAVTDFRVAAEAHASMRYAMSVYARFEDETAAAGGDVDHEFTRFAARCPGVLNYDAAGNWTGNARGESR
jgi:hypothetical protein